MTIRTQLSEALTLLAVIVVGFPPILSVCFWLRFDAPIWSAF